MSEEKILSSMGLRPMEEAMQDEDTTQKMESQLPANSFDTDAPNLPIPASKEAEENLKDIELAKRNIENIISLGDDSVKEMVEIAKQSESPRAFEVVSTLMKTLLDANKDFVEMSTKKRYAKEEHKTETNVTNNNLIVSTADLLKMIKGEND